MDYSSGHPVIMVCSRMGRWRSYGVLPFGVILCDDCYVTILLERAARQNEAALKRWEGE